MDFDLIEAECSHLGRSVNSPHEHQVLKETSFIHILISQKKKTTKHELKPKCLIVFSLFG